MSGKMTASFTDHPRSRGVYISLPHGDHIHVGSSPLARGLQRRGCLRQAQARIIPARAGFTVTIRELLCPRGDHPRSRGVYRDNAARPMEGMGSSPLARGLRLIRSNRQQTVRIIPARAGFTADGMRSEIEWRDHPRSRGVYSDASSPRTPRAGSSPLARGLPMVVLIEGLILRIIPARAGFTRRWRKFCELRAGSSPLARGLLSKVIHLLVINGIIPARAGFTEAYSSSV